MVQVADRFRQTAFGFLHLGQNQARFRRMPFAAEDVLRDRPGFVAAAERQRGARLAQLPGGGNARTGFLLRQPESFVGFRGLAGFDRRLADLGLERAVGVRQDGCGLAEMHQRGLRIPVAQERMREVAVIFSVLGFQFGGALQAGQGGGAVARIFVPGPERVLPGRRFRSQAHGFQHFIHGFFAPPEFGQDRRRDGMRQRAAGCVPDRLLQRSQRGFGTPGLPLANARQRAAGFFFRLEVDRALGGFAGAFGISGAQPGQGGRGGGLGRNVLQVQPFEFVDRFRLGL